MGQFRTTADIADEVLQKSGEPTNGNSPYEALVVKYLNKVHQALIGGGNIFSLDVDEVFPWSRARHPMVLELLPAYVTGTITCTAGDINITFSSPPAYSVAGWYIQLNDSNRSTVYRITSHEAGQDAATIDSTFLDDSGDYAFRVVKLDYELIPAYIYIDSKNDKLEFIESGTTVLTATLTHGTYTPTTLLAHILAKLEDVGTNGLYTGAYDEVSRKFTLTSTLAGGKIFSLLGATGTNRKRSVLPLLGFDRLDHTGAGTYTSGYVTNGISRLVEPFRVFAGQSDSLKIFSLDNGNFEADYGMSYTSERVPEHFTKIHHENDGTVVVRFSSYPKYRTKVMIDWVPIPIDLQDNDASVPLIPRNEIDILIHGASTFILFDKEDDKWEKTLSVTDKHLQAMRKKLRSESFRTSEDYGQIVPRGDMVGGRRKFRYGYTANPGATGAELGTPATPMVTKNFVYTDFHAAALTTTVLARTLPGNRTLLTLIAQVTQAFAGGSISALVVDVGTAGNPTQFINGLNIMGLNQDSAVLVFYPGVNTAINVRVTAVGANLSALTQGAMKLIFNEEVVT